jgi:hypothetical protein
MSTSDRDNPDDAESFDQRTPNQQHMCHNKGRGESHVLASFPQNQDDERPAMTQEPFAEVVETIGHRCQED